MRIMSKTIIAVTTLLVAVSLITAVWGDFVYETVGGKISSVDLVTVFLVPALIALGIFGALVILGVIRVKSKTDS